MINMIIMINMINMIVMIKKINRFQHQFIQKNQLKILNQIDF
jgi:hypothetical protein